MQGKLNDTVAFWHHHLVFGHISSAAISSPAERCQLRAREAAVKAELAKDSKDKVAWLLAAERWTRLAEDIDHGQVLQP